MGTMISKESVRRRLDSEQGISFTEFAYQLLQGYDFVHLARTAGVRVQVRAAGSGAGGPCGGAGACGAQPGQARPGQARRAQQAGRQAGRAP